MNNQFDMLAKVALNEASLGDYLKAAKSMAGKAVKGAVGGAVKGLAQLPGAAIKGAANIADFAAKDSGMSYGGTFGTVAKAGNTLQKAGLAAITAPIKLWKNLKTTAEKQEYIRKNLPPIKGYILKKFPTLTSQQQQKLAKVKNFDELDNFAKDNIKGRSLDQVMYDYNKAEVEKAEAQAAEKEKTTTTTQPPVNQQITTTGINARTAEGNPVPGQTRYTTANRKNTYLYSKNGWMSKNNDTNKYEVSKQQAQITAAWQKAQNITPVTKPTKTKPVTKKSSQTKYGTPVTPATSADLASMNLPQHPLTSKTPPNIRR